MSRDLPDRPSLEQLKKQARELQQAFAAGEPAAMALACEHLPRLRGASSEQARQAELSLQEAQQVLAADYGFINWSWLKAIVDIDFELFARLTDREIQTALREIDQKDVVAALTGASSAARTAALSNMSQRVQRFIEEEMEFLGDQVRAEAPAAQRRILRVLHDLAQQGQVDWPQGDADTRVGRERSERMGRARVAIDYLRQPLEILSPEQVAEMWQQVAAQATQHGILSLASLPDEAVEPLITEGLQLTLDGTEPALIEDLLRTRLECVLLPRMVAAAAMVAQAAAGVRAGESPVLVLRRLYARFCTFGEEADAAAQLDSRISADELAGHLRAQPFASLDNAARVVLLAHVGCLARSQGPASLAALVDATDDETLRLALGRLAREADAAELARTLERHSSERLRQARARWVMCITGVRMMQDGKRPEAIRDGVLRAGQEVLATT